MDFATAPAAPPARKNQRATSCPAPISAIVPYQRRSRLICNAFCSVSTPASMRPPQRCCPRVAASVVGQAPPLGCPRPRSPETLHGRRGSRLLLGWLDLQRALVPYKCEELSDEDAHRAVLSTSPRMTVAGLVSHLRWTEHCWFEVIFLDRPADAHPRFGDAEDADFMVDDVPLAQLLAEFSRHCAFSNEIVAAASLDEVGRHPEYGGETLRWILLHMLEEVARLVLHLDLLREQLDGVKGYW